MVKTYIRFLILFVLACNSKESRIKQKESKLANEMTMFLIPGKYEAQLIDFIAYERSPQNKKSHLTLSNEFRIVKFKGNDQFRELDSLSINLNDSVLIRNFAVNRFIDTISVFAGETGIQEDFLSYAFGNKNTGGILDLEEFKDLVNPEMASNSQSLYLIGWAKKSRCIVLKQMEKVVSEGRILLDIDRVFILTPLQEKLKNN